MRHKITLIPGDGIGPEVTEAARLCLEATGLDLEWEEQLIGQTALEKKNSLLPQETLESIKKNKVALKGPATTPVGESFRSVNVALRKELDLYVNLRPVLSLGCIKEKYSDVDIVVVRENTEDLYAGIEFDVGDEFTLSLIEQINSKYRRKLSPNTAISLKTISKEGSSRIAKFAFEYALKNNRQKISCVHKANILKFSDGLFLKTFYQIAKDYGTVEANDYIVDNLSMQLVLRPQNFDVLVLPNLYGDIISDLCSGLVGGLGLAPGGNIGKDIAVFEPVHGSAPKYAGKNKVNPAATILSGALMLKYMGYIAEAEKVQRAIKEVIQEGKDLTYDLKPDRNDPAAAGTSQMAQAIAEKIRSY
jgi:isocitrate dehydrogenase (NAD+)